MKIIRAIKYILGFVKREDKWLMSPEEELSKRPNIIARLTGELYRKYRQLQERWRVRRYNLREDYRNLIITSEILHHSAKFIFYLLLVILASVLLDVAADPVINAAKSVSFLTSRFDLPSKDFIKLILGIFVGAISAILGIIFALYAVGFQIATERYSGRVTEYINRDPAIRYFFGLLVFTDLFSLYSLLKLQLTASVPYASFAICVFLVFLQ
jgi:uncharacterized integral membrane protein